MALTAKARNNGAAAIAFLVTFFAGALLVTIRGEVDNSVTVLLLAAVVSACGLLGGWRAGAAGALAAAASFNFFHTEPYLSLRIHDVDDIITTATLLVVGLIGGVAAHVLSARQAAAVEAGTELRAIERVARLIADDADPEDVKRSVLDELVTILLLSACEFSVEPPVAAVVLGPSGSLGSSASTYHDGGFELPEAGVDLPVVARGETYGYLICTPLPDTSVSLQRRRTAATLVGLLGVAMAGARRPIGESSD